MAVATDVGVRIRYAPAGLGFPFRGWWDARAQSIGTASGGNNVARVIPNAPQNRIFRVDFFTLFWETALGSNDSKVSIGLSGQGNGVIGQVAMVDMSGQDEGSQQLLMGEGHYWRANDPADPLAQWLAGNVNTNAMQMVLSGVFYEAEV